MAQAVLDAGQTDPEQITTALATLETSMNKTHKALMVLLKAAQIGLTEDEAALIGILSITIDLTRSEISPWGKVNITPSDVERTNTVNNKLVDGLLAYQVEGEMPEDWSSVQEFEFLLAFDDGQFGEDMPLAQAKDWLTADILGVIWWRYYDAHFVCSLGVIGLQHGQGSGQIQACHLLLESAMESEEVVWAQMAELYGIEVPFEQ